MSIIKQEKIKDLIEDLTIYEAFEIMELVKSKYDEKLSDRFDIFPIDPSQQFSYYYMEVLNATHWTIHSVQLQKDVYNFNDVISEKQRNALKNVITFFAYADSLISDTTCAFMESVVPTIEQKMYYKVQGNNELNHAIAYHHMIEILIPDIKERHSLKTAIDTHPTHIALFGFMDDITKRPKLCYNYVAIAAAEFLLFNPNFVLPMWFRSNMPGMVDEFATLNRYILKDEIIHYLHSLTAHNTLPEEERITEEEIVDIVVECIRLMDDYYTNLYSSCEFEDITVDNLKMFSRYLANRFLQDFKFKTVLYPNAYNPFDFMGSMLLEPKTNFYDHHETNYSRKEDESEDYLKNAF